MPRFSLLNFLCCFSISNYQVNSCFSLICSSAFFLTSTRFSFLCQFFLISTNPSAINVSGDSFVYSVFIFRFSSCFLVSLPPFWLPFRSATTISQPLRRFIAVAECISISPISIFSPPSDSFVSFSWFPLLTPSPLSPHVYSDGLSITFSSLLTYIERT